MTSVFCDLDKDLYMYSVPSLSRNYLSKRFPSVDFYYAPSLEPTSVLNHDVYWGNTPPEDLLSLLPNLEWIHLGCVGLDRVLKIRGDTSCLKITNSPGSVTESVSAHTLYQLFYFLRDGRRIYFMNADLNLQNRQYYNLSSPLPGSVYGLKVAIIGFGHIGKSVGSALVALGADVHGYGTRSYEHSGIIVSPLDSFLRNSSQYDCVISLLPQQDSLVSFFGEQIFCSLKESCIFINNGRSSHVDEFALRASITHGNIRFASDTVDNPAMFTELFNNGYDVLVSPHIAAVGPHYWPKQIDLFAKLLQDFTEAKH